MNDRILHVMSKAFKEIVNEESNMDSVDNWDSLNHVNMIVMLEREFNIEIPDDVVGNMTSYKLVELNVKKYV